MMVSSQTILQSLFNTYSAPDRSMQTFLSQKNTTMWSHIFLLMVPRASCWLLSSDKATAWLSLVDSCIENNPRKLWIANQIIHLLVKLTWKCPFPSISNHLQTVHVPLPCYFPAVYIILRQPQHLTCWSSCTGLHWSWYNTPTSVANQT